MNSSTPDELTVICKQSASNLLPTSVIEVHVSNLAYVICQIVDCTHVYRNSTLMICVQQIRDVLPQDMHKKLSSRRGTCDALFTHTVADGVGAWVS